MKFEFDSHKSCHNKAKHGIDFTEAQALWDDPARVVLAARSEDEPRYLVIGMLYGKYWSGFFTYRGDRVRIISVRRARENEVELYES